MTSSETCPQSLPRAAWTQRPDLAQLIAALGPGNARWVGGAVRDTLLGYAVKDVDCATRLLPDQVVERLNAAGIRHAPTGIEHGTITAILPGGAVEITSLRRDVATDGRRATIVYAQDWHEDAARRDFTINALYAHPESLEIFDYFGGLADLATCQVRFIGDPHDRIREDHLRILRYFRFQARFGARLDDAAEAACAELRDTLKGLSRERVAMELLNLLSLPDPAPTVARMHQLGVLQVVLPEAGGAEIAALKSLIVAERVAEIPPDALRRMAALLPPVPAVAESVAARLRLSNRQRQRLGLVAERAPEDAANPRALAYRAGRQCAEDRLLLLGADISALAGWEIPAFPLKGGTIVTRGVKAGPEVARIMHAVESRWVAEGFPPQDRLDTLLQEALSGNL